jgi:hypothetical protein
MPRGTPYLAAMQAPDGAEVTLRAAAAIQLCPLGAAAVSGYLHHDTGGPACWSLSEQAGIAEQFQKTGRL